MSSTLHTSAILYCFLEGMTGLPPTSQIALPGLARNGDGPGLLKSGNAKKTIRKTGTAVSRIPPRESGPCRRGLAAALPDHDAEWNAVQIEGSSKLVLEVLPVRVPPLQPPVREQKKRRGSAMHLRRIEEPPRSASLCRRLVAGHHPV